jgi:hypothetical protein
MVVALLPLVTPLEDACCDPYKRVEKRLQARKNENEEVPEQAT